MGFSFGSGAQRGWASLAVTFVSGAGRLHTVCPLLPTEPREALPHLLAVQVRGWKHANLQAFQRPPALFTATSSITQPPHAPPHHQVELRAVCPTAPAASWIASQLAGAASAGVGGAVGVAVQGPLRVVDAHDAPVLPSSSSSSSPARRALALVTLPLPGLRPVHCVGLSDGAVLVVAAMQPTQPKWIGDEATDQARASSGGGGGGGGGGAAPLLLLSQAHCMPPSVGEPAELQWMSLVADPFRRGWVYARTSRAEVHLLAMGRRSAWTRPGVAAPETVPAPAPALVASRLGAVVSRGHRSAPQRATGMAPGPPSHQVAA